LREHAPTLELLTIWTIRGSLLMLAAVMCGRLAGWRWAASSAARWAWTAGLLAAVLHVLLALHVHHGWSHRAAQLATSREVEAMFGWRFDAAIYFNYAFLAIWACDAAWWWAEGASFPRRRWLTAWTNAFLLLVAWNAVVVFEDGRTRAAGLTATALLLASFLVARVRWRAVEQSG
jgi:hypothetical protein